MEWRCSHKGHCLSTLINLFKKIPCGYAQRSGFLLVWAPVKLTITPRLFYKIYIFMKLKYNCIIPPFPFSLPSFSHTLPALYQIHSLNGQIHVPIPSTVVYSLGMFVISGLTTRKFFPAFPPFSHHSLLLFLFRQPC